MSGSQEKTLTDKVSSLTEELSSIRVKRANLKSDLNEMTALVQQMKNDVERSICNGSTEAKESYENMAKANKLKIEADLVDWWKEIETRFQVESTCLAVGDEEKLLHQYSDVQNSLVKISTLFRSRVTKALDVGSSCSESSAIGA